LYYGLLLIVALSRQRGAMDETSNIIVDGCSIDDPRAQNGK
jgi:hypothetical protein